MALRLPRTIYVHERRYQSRDAIKRPWDENTVEKPEVVVMVAEPEVKQPGRANPAEGKGDGKSVVLIPRVSLWPKGPFFWFAKGAKSDERDVQRDIPYPRDLLESRE